MSELAFASGAMQERIAPKGVAQYVEGRIAYAAQKLGWKISRARTIWYADERASLKPHELRRVEKVAGVQYGREEVRQVSDLISQADALLMGVHEDFHRPFVAAFRAFFGALDRSRVEGDDQ
jgi:hypothetical protein